MISNDIFCNVLRNSGRTGVIASEEEATPVAVEETTSGNYIVVFDPLDGSSNIDAGVCLVGATKGVNCFMMGIHSSTPRLPSSLTSTGSNRCGDSSCWTSC